jgi:hypothetical protein
VVCGQARLTRKVRLAVRSCGAGAGALATLGKREKGIVLKGNNNSERKQFNEQKNCSRGLIDDH